MANPNWVFYTRFGLKLKSDRDHFAATCPFCSKEGHFSIRQDSGVYKCLVCPANGNHYTFIREYYQLCLVSTTATDYAELSANRHLLVETLKQGGLAKAHTGNWLLPSRNEQGEVMNLYQAIPYHEETQQETSPPSIPYNPGQQYPNGSTDHKRPPVPPAFTQREANHAKYRIESASEPCTQQIYGAENNANQSRVAIGEGHWDRLALWEIFAHLAPRSLIKSGNGGNTIPGFPWDMIPLQFPVYNNPIFDDLLILSAPGSSQWKKEWLRYVKNRHVILIYDNDPDKVICTQCRGREGYRAHLYGTPCPMCRGVLTTGQIINPGRDGLNRVVKEIDDTGTPVESIMKVNWAPTDVKDVRDLLCIH